MAKILLGATIGDARNAAGAIVYSKNRFGAYVRQKVSPVQPRTPRQTAVRNQLKTASQGWQALTSTQQAGWTALAAGNPVIDVFGNSQVLTGHQFYTRVNRNLDLIGVAHLSTAPANQTVTAPTSATLTADSVMPALSLAFTPTPAGSNLYAVAWLTPGLSPGKNFIKPFLKFVTHGTANTASPLNLLAAWQAIFGTFSAGQKISGFLQFMNSTNGALSTPLNYFAIAT